MDDYKWMASRVKEVLPQVPLDTIQRDLSVTNSIDETITRLLDGILSFTEEPTSQTATNSCSTGSTAAVSRSDSSNKDDDDKDDCSKPVQPTPEPEPSLNTAAKTFSTSPTKRMESFKQRKQDLIQAARQRYMRKHGLQS